MTFSELLGKELFQHNETNSISIDQLKGKTVVLYFSARSCSPDRELTPRLAELFKGIDNEMKDKLDIVFISSDEGQAAFDEYFKEMPWKALPFSDRERSKTLSEKFNIDYIPSLVVLSPSCEVLVSDGVPEILVASSKALSQWLQGKSIFWSREVRQGEYVWEDIICTQCYMNPLVGSRHGCTNRECDINLCETCLPNNKHDHPLVEYFIPRRHYSLEQLLESVPYLLSPNKDEKIAKETLWEEGVKSVGFYFSAHWCSPCRQFTPTLVELYKQFRASSQSFRIIFVSSDRDEESFNEYRSVMPWLAVPLNSGTLLKPYFQFSGIPSLLVLLSDGTVLSRRGYSEVLQGGIEALKTWAQGEKVVPPTADEFKWPYFTCDGCKIVPVVGQIYYCSTCGNYDLCSACEKKGHEHPLRLIPKPPGEDD